MTVPGSMLGVIANPMSGRDIRRLVSHASVFPNAEKTNMIRRILSAAAATGVETVLLGTDPMGVAAGVVRSLAGTPVDALPMLEFVELPEFSQTAQDTVDLVAAMRSRGCGAIILLGGDGTVRAAASASEDTPLLPLSTGTNNAFPQMWEATVAGLSAALLVTGRIDDDAATVRAKVLRVDVAGRSEIALVDACLTAVAHIGSRALWQAESLRDVFCTFAEPHAVGLSSIAGQVYPVSRDAPHGVHLRLTADPSAPLRVTAPIAPGVVTTVGVTSVSVLEPGVTHRLTAPGGTLALDGEREIELNRTEEVAVTLSAHGPVVVDVRRVLALAAERCLLIRIAHPLDIPWRTDESSTVPRPG